MNKGKTKKNQLIKFNQNGITLIALTITIVILIILAVVAINATFGDSGLIDQAEKAASYQANAEATDSKMLNDASDYLDSITNVDVDLSSKMSVWFGDSVVRGYLNNDKGFPEYYAEMTNSENFYNASVTSSTIDSSKSNNIITQVNWVTDYAKQNGINIDFFVFDGGGNDVLNSTKEIGTVDMETSGATQGDTIMSDFEEIIVKMKTSFPEAKILYIQLLSISNSEDNEILNENQKQRLINIVEQTEIAANKHGIEYLSIADNILDEYHQTDGIHYNHLGYTNLTPLIIEKLKSIYR